MKANNTVKHVYFYQRCTFFFGKKHGDLKITITEAKSKVTHDTCVCEKKNSCHQQISRRATSYEKDLFLSARPVCACAMRKKNIWGGKDVCIHVYLCVYRYTIRHPMGVYHLAKKKNAKFGLFEHTQSISCQKSRISCQKSGTSCQIFQHTQSMKQNEENLALIF